MIKSIMVLKNVDIMHNSLVNIKNDGKVKN